MIVITNRIPVSKGHEIDFEDRFKKRAHLVDRAPGFVRNEVHRPRPVKFEHATGGWVQDDAAQGYYEVKTWWRDFEDFDSGLGNRGERRSARFPHNQRCLQILCVEKPFNDTHLRRVFFQNLTQRLKNLNQALRTLP